MTTTYSPASPVPMAARRDASWYSCPGRAGRYHIVAPDGIGSLCGLQMLAADGEWHSGMGIAMGCQVER